MSEQDNLLRLKQLIEHSHNIVVLSGAGMSTESGIPDFRSSGGFWTNDELLEAMSDDYLKTQPLSFWPKFKQVFMREEFLNAQPNAGHKALSDLEAQGKHIVIYTQNVDGLHYAAGSRRVYELHGSVRKAICPVCRTQYGVSHIMTEEVPKCDWLTPKGGDCGHILHPDTVLFGQDIRFYREAVLHFMECDLALILGTSLTVEPAASLPSYVKQGQGRLVIINLEPTELDRYADLVIHGKVGETLSQLSQMIGGHRR